MPATFWKQKHADPNATAIVKENEYSISYFHEKRYALSYQNINTYSRFIPKYLPSVE